MMPEDARFLYWIGLALALWLAWRIFRIVRSRLREDRERRERILHDVERFERNHDLESRTGEGSS